MNAPTHAFLLSCSFLILTLAPGRAETTAALSPDTTAPMTLLIIEDKNHPSYKQEEFLSQLQNSFKYMSIEKYYQEELLGKKLIKSLKIRHLPAYLLTKDFEKNQYFPWFRDNKMAEARKDYYLLSPRLAKPSIYLKRPPQKNTLQIFVMSQCPFGVNALNQLSQAMQAGKISPEVKLVTHYIVSEDLASPNPALPFRSLHGPAEAEENMRQLAIQKYHPDQFFAYLSVRNKDYNSPVWEPAAQNAGLDPVKLAKKMTQKGVKLLKKDVRLTQELGISVSPSFLWENQLPIHELSDLKKIPAFAQFEPTPFKGGCGQKTP